jgi:Limiting CO2-inducible proteins B/C beta carbonyic anhydrases
LAGSTLPAVAHAKKAVKAVQAAKQTVDITEIVASVAGGALIAILVKSFFGGGGGREAKEKIAAVYPGSLKNKVLVAKVQKRLKKFGYNSKNTLLSTSFCSDEVSRSLENEFSFVYDDNYCLGGLTGFPFGGKTSFGVMAANIPDNGSCLVVFGPHVGVDITGAVGTVELRGRDVGGPCCASAIAASKYVDDVSNGRTQKSAPPSDPLDSQQTYVDNLLLPYAKRLDNASDRLVELPYALYDAQKRMMMEIIKAGFNNVAGKGKIAVLGGIQLNTPAGMSDYFKPMSFEVYDNQGVLLEDFTAKF